LQKEKQRIIAQLQSAPAAHEQERLSRTLLEHNKQIRAMEQEVNDSISAILGD